MHFVFIQMQGVKGIRCIIHVEDDSVETSVKVLQIMSRHSQKSNYRTAHANQSKYLSITESLTDTFNPSMGYHSHCYKNFTATQKPKKNTT